MRTISVNLFSFDELSEDIQSKVIDNFRDINVDHDWWEHVYEAFKEDCEFEVDRIYFSGFCSQGDGAMFEYSRVPDTLKASFIEGLKLSPMRKAWLMNNVSVSGHGKHSGHYYHENSCYHDIYWEVDNGDLNWSTRFYQWIESFYGEFEDYVIEIYKDKCQDLYRDLEKEYDCLTSDEQVRETILCNEYEFNEYGQVQ